MENVAKRRRRGRNVYIPMRPPTSEVLFSLHWELSAREAGEGRAAKVKAWMCPCLLGAPLSCRMRLDWRRQLGWWAENRERAQRGGAGLTSSSPWSCGGMRAHARAAAHTHAVSFLFQRDSRHGTVMPLTAKTHKQQEKCEREKLEKPQLV